MSILFAIKSLKTTNKTAKTVQTLLSQHPNITINWIKAQNGHLGNEKTGQLAKRAAIEGTAFNLQKPVSFLKKTLTQLSLESWQREWEEGTTSRHTFDVLPKVALISKQWSMNEILFVTGHSPFPSYFKRFGLTVSDNCDVGTPCHYATACRLTLPFHFKTPSTIHKLPWLQNLVSNPHARRKQKILMELIQTNEQLLNTES
ncbi:hypothetical protein AVEN_59227-1 [Araneus ventricosus]|uniref:RNase H type-1 domain-containing protein n=1 Tax=Araneus ventricosus TaxID=182803 RepID=A0A4Y2CZG4_ARAVE|nr:hypothetical protein AVEN_59227-1 [Araneus ventricosus]